LLSAPPSAEDRARASPGWIRANLAARTCGAALLGAALAVSPAGAARPNGILGAWSVQDGHGVVAIEPCGDALCGRIVGIDRAPGEPIPTDVHGASQCGLTIISRERPSGDGAWLGEITDPRTGRTYRARLWVDDAGNLRLRGSLGLSLLGRTQTWRPFTGHLSAACGLS
jgi:uncharacterized protein (DUF2147 family)